MYKGVQTCNLGFFALLYYGAGRMRITYPDPLLIMKADIAGQ
jgi:hypothetical protein